MAHAGGAKLSMYQLTEAEALTLELVKERWPRLYFARRHHRTTKDRPLTFANRLWLKQMYKDSADQIVIQKASQVGITDWLLCDLFMSTAAGHPYLYILPTDAWRNDFVPRRIDKQIQFSAYYRANVSPIKKDSDKKSQKVLFGTDVRFVGAQNPNNFYEFPCDIIAFDEFDKCDKDNIVYAFDRMAQAGRDRWRIVGNPSYSDYGISRVYGASDHKEWHIKCDHCNTWQMLDWFVNFVTPSASGKQQYDLRDAEGRCLCKKCAQPINRIGNGEWVAANPGETVSGYHVSQLFGLPHEIMPKLYDVFQSALLNQTELQRFYNNILGIIYDPEGDKLNPHILAQCAVDTLWDAAPRPVYVAGIDVGTMWHVHISECRNGKRYKVVATAVAGRAETERLLAQYPNLVKGVIDAHGDLSAVRDFVRNNPIWLMCEYNKAERVGEKYIIDRDRQVIRVNRTESMDASHQAYMIRDIILPPNWRDLDSGDFVNQMCMPTRIAEQDGSGRFTGRYIWTKGTDHHRHADNYELLAFLVSGAGQPFWPGAWI